MTREERKALVGLAMGDSLRQLIKRSQAILERMSKDGVESCASIDLDVLMDAQQCWKHSNAMYQIIQTELETTPKRKNATKASRK